MFTKYMHLERFGNDEVQGIELGTVYVFPKLDGTNASVWQEDNMICAGSRNRQLSLEKDNAGFYKYVQEDDRLRAFLEKWPNLRLFGEWLVPHTLKTYRDDAWRQFYVFDVMDERGQYLPYDWYAELLEQHAINYVPPLCIMHNATYDNLLVELQNNRYLIKDGEGEGEGIVLKNYKFINSHSRTVWAKIVTNKFKGDAAAKQPTVKTMKEMTEIMIVEKYVTEHLVNKVYAKICVEHDGWNSRYIPQLLQTVFYDLVNEETWTIVKTAKLPTINFRTLNSLTIMKVKDLLPQLY